MAAKNAKAADNCAPLGGQSPTGCSANRLNIAFRTVPGSHRAVTGGDLDAAEERHGVTVESGDALVVRGGRTVTDDSPVPGISTEEVRWMHRRGVSLYAGDIGDARHQRHGAD